MNNTEKPNAEIRRGNFMSNTCEILRNGKCSPLACRETTCSIPGDFKRFERPKDCTGPCRALPISATVFCHDMQCETGAMIRKLQKFMQNGKNGHR